MDWLPTLARATGALPSDALASLGFDGNDMAEELLHGTTTSNTRSEALLRLNKWRFNHETGKLDALEFNHSFMALIQTDAEGRKWKVLYNEFESPHVAPNETVGNLSCFVTRGVKRNHLYDLTHDPLETHDVKDEVPDVFYNLTLSLRKWCVGTRRACGGHAYAAPPGEGHPRPWVHPSPPQNPTHPLPPTHPCPHPMLPRPPT